jgi:diguanylate cyclase (GGDEF)-like protein/PAS domain S-box-containing protein
MKQHTIRHYVAWLTLLPLFIMTTSLEIYFLHDRSSNLDHELIEHGKLIARQLASSSEYGVFSNNKSFLENIAQGVLQQPDVSGLVILNTAAETLVEVGEFHNEQVDTVADIHQETTGLPGSKNPIRGGKIKEKVNPLISIRSSDNSVWFYQPIVSTQVPLDELAPSPATRHLGAVIIEISRARTNQLKSQMLWVTLGSTTLFLIIALYLINRASRTITSPISKLSDAVQLIRQGNLDTRISLSTHVSELSSLARGVNDMAVQLQQENLILQERMEEATRIAAIAFDSHEGMMVTDPNCVILRVNNAFTKITGYTDDEAVGQMAHLLKSGRHDANFYAAMWNCIKQTGSWQGEIWNLRKNGDTYPAWLTVTAIQQGDGPVAYYVATISDITSRLEAEQEIKFMAFYDTLTQLPNRRMLMDRLGQAMAASKRSGRYGALMFLDLDNFKTLNDKYGHAFGDFILVEASRRICSCVREIDTVSRFGGDEFVVMLGELDTDKAESMTQAGSVAEKIRATLAEPYTMPTKQGDTDTAIRHYCTSSIGVILFANDENSAEDLLEWSDRAMYIAKRDGRNLIRFNV